MRPPGQILRLRGEPEIVAFGAPLGLSVALFVLSSYLSHRFDTGTPIIRASDPLLTIWLSVGASVVVLLVWLVVVLGPAGLIAPMRRTPRGLRARPPRLRGEPGGIAGRRGSRRLRRGSVRGTDGGLE